MNAKTATLLRRTNTPKAAWYRLTRKERAVKRKQLKAQVREERIRRVVWVEREIGKLSGESLRRAKEHLEGLRRLLT